MPNTNSVKEFFAAIVHKHMSSNKVESKELMDRLMAMKDDNMDVLKTYVMKMVGVTNKLNKLKILIAKPFLVHHVLNSLLVQFS